MFGRSFTSKDRVGKLQKPQKRSFRDHVKQMMADSLGSPPLDSSTSPALTSPIITIVVGKEQRLLLPMKMFYRIRRGLPQLCETTSSVRALIDVSSFPTRNLKFSRAFSSTYTRATIRHAWSMTDVVIRGYSRMKLLFTRLPLKSAVAAAPVRLLVPVGSDLRLRQFITRV